jgi:hypothetical protein
MLCDKGNGHGRLLFVVAILERGGLEVVVPRCDMDERLIQSNRLLLFQAAYAYNRRKGRVRPARKRGAPTNRIVGNSASHSSYITVRTIRNA